MDLACSKNKVCVNTYMHVYMELCHIKFKVMTYGIELVDIDIDEHAVKYTTYVYRIQ